MVWETAITSEDWKQKNSEPGKIYQYCHSFLQNWQWITKSSLQVNYVETIHTKRDLEGPYLAMYAFHNQDFLKCRKLNIMININVTLLFPQGFSLLLDLCIFFSTCWIQDCYLKVIYSSTPTANCICA